MFRWLRGSSGDQAGSGSAAPPSALSLPEQLSRVTREDLAAVTEADIAAVKAEATPEELTAAMRAMMEQQRFSDVLACSSSSAWGAAARGVTPVQMGMIGSLVREQTSLLYGVLPYVSEDFLDTMRAAFVRPAQNSPP